MTLSAHAEQVDIEDRCWLTWFGVRNQNVCIGTRGGIEVGAESCVARRHRMNIAGRDVDVVQKCLAGLFLVAFVIVVRHVPIVTPEQMDSCPIDGVRTEVFEQGDAGASAGQHNQRPTARRDGSRDLRHEAVTHCGHQFRGVGIGLDGYAHGQPFTPAGY